MHFTQPLIRDNLCRWTIPSTPFLVQIILEHSRSLTNGLTMRMPALTILRRFDGRMVLSAQAAELKPKVHL